MGRASGCYDVTSDAEQRAEAEGRFNLGSGVPYLNTFLFGPVP